LTGLTVICLDLHTPAILEKEDFHRALTGDENKDNRKFRHRLIALDDEHARIAPYAHHLRLVLANGNDIQKFASLCKISGVPTPFKVILEASQRGLYTARTLRDIQRWVAACEWPTAFQIELLMHNGLVSSEELLADLYEPIMNIYREDKAVCADLLRNFAEGLHNATRPKGDTALRCFFRVLEDKKGKAPLETPAGMFSCHHVTFTPTRLILEGP
jgi:RNA-dependent RNA polymerase